jgi:hypothetical protein
LRHRPDVARISQVGHAELLGVVAPLGDDACGHPDRPPDPAAPGIHGHSERGVAKPPMTVTVSPISDRRVTVPVLKDEIIRPATWLSTATREGR